MAWSHQEIFVLFFSHTGHWQGRMGHGSGVPRTRAPFRALLSWAIACDPLACQYPLIRNIKAFTDFSTPVARTGSQRHSTLQNGMVNTRFPTFRVKTAKGVDSVFEEPNSSVCYMPLCSSKIICIGTLNTYFLKILSCLFHLLYHEQFISSLSCSCSTAEVSKR